MYQHSLIHISAIFHKFIQIVYDCNLGGLVIMKHHAEQPLYTA